MALTAAVLSSRVRETAPAGGAGGEQVTDPVLAERSPAAARVAVVNALIPCVIYAAKSTEDVRGSNVTQIADCRVAIAAAGGRDVAGVFADEKASGFSASRGPALTSAMSLAEGLTASGVAAELWVQHSDRLARGDGIVARHMVELALWALKAGIKVRCVQDDQTFDDLLFALLAGRASHHESARKGRAVAAGLKRAAERGEHHGVKVDGYRIAVDVDNGRVTKRLEFDPERRELFKLIFAMALTGSTGAEIVRALNAAGHLTKPWRKRHSPAPFTRSRVSRILRNPRYAGLSAHRGQLSGSGLWPAYISPAEYEVIQSRRKPVPGAGVARLPRQAYLLCTVAVCGVCGSKMTSLNGTPRRQDGLRSRRYLCRSHQEPGGCAAPPLDAAVADLAVARSLRWLLAGGGELGGEEGAIPCSGGGRDLDGIGVAPRLIRDSDTSALMRAVSDAARSGDVPAAERGLEALVSHS